MVHCDSHGEAPEAFVCQHVLTGLVDRERVGFFWTIDDPENPYPDAWCLECEERVKEAGGEWEGEVLEQLQPRLMCGHCCEIAKVFHMGSDPWS